MTSTQPRSPTTTGKIERFHRSPRAEFRSAHQPFATLRVAQQALDEWVAYYNISRPHQALDMSTPSERFAAGTDVHVDGELLLLFIGDDLVKTAARTSRTEVRNKRACRTPATA